MNRLTKMGIVLSAGIGIVLVGCTDRASGPTETGATTERLATTHSDFVDIGESIIRVLPTDEREYRDTDVVIQSTIADRPVSVKVSLDEYERLRLDGRAFDVDISMLSSVMTRNKDRSFGSESGSLRAAIDGAVATLHGNVVAYGFVMNGPTHYAIGFQIPVSVGDAPDPVSTEVEVFIDPDGVCNGVVWGGDDCNDGECRILWIIDGRAIWRDAECVFHDVPWNPWNFCNCEGV